VVFGIRLPMSACMDGASNFANSNPTVGFS